MTEQTKTVGIGYSGIISHNSAPAGYHIAAVSSNTSIVSVSSGLTITAISAGTAVITAYYIDDNNSALYTIDYCYVTVSGSIPVVSITLQEYGGMFEGETLTLNYSTTPANLSVTWSIVSHNGTISINSSTGLISANKAGNAIIRATISGTSVHADCSVTVRIQDGIYRLGNNFNEISYKTICACDGDITQDRRLKTVDFSPHSEAGINVLWKITYMQHGYCAIRPFFKLDKALCYKGGYAVISNEDIINYDSLSNTPQNAWWSIFYDGGGYVLLNQNNRMKALTVDSNNNIILAQYTASENNKLTLYTKDIISGSQLYNTYFGVLLYDCIDYLAPFSSHTYIAAVYSRLTNIQNVTWSCPTNCRKTFDGVECTVTGLSSGTATITATITARSTQDTSLVISDQFEIATVPEGDCYIKSVYDTIDSDLDYISLTSSSNNTYRADYTGNENQYVKLTLLSDGYYTMKISGDSSNNYLTVENSGNNQDTNIISQTNTGTPTDGQKWKIIEVNRKDNKGMHYKIIPKCGESVNRSMCCSCVGTNINLQTYVDDTNYKDEWYIYSDYITDVTLIADEDAYADFGAAFPQIINNTKSQYPQALVSYGNTVGIGAHNSLKNSKICVISAHGSINRIELCGDSDYYTISLIDELRGDPLGDKLYAGSQLIILLSCETAGTGGNYSENSLYAKVLENTNGIVIGFNGRILTGEANLWVSKLFEKLNANHAFDDNELTLTEVMSAINYIHNHYNYSSINDYIVYQ